MNREQKRAFVKKAKKRGVSANAAKAYAEIISNGAGQTTPKQDIAEDEKVKLNIETIKARQNYEKMSDKYKEFVDTNADTIFTAHIERPTLISLKEEPKWLFWCGDLIKMKINKKHIVTSPTEHDSVLRAIESLCNPLCCNDKKCIKPEFYTSFLPVDKRGHIQVDELEHMSYTYDDIGLVSVMYANNEIGVLNNVASVGHICRKKHILFHTDCVQAAGSVALDVTKIGCDFMSISSHKIHGVKGVGALYVRDKQYLSPIINGGLVQEFGLRGGTENVAGIVGFGKACELAGKGIEDYSRTVISFKKHFCEILKDRLADEHMETDVSINGLLPKYPGKTLSLTFKNVDAETLVLMMGAKGVCISAGSACTSHESNPSHVLKAIGLSDDEARSTVRISFSEFNTVYEVERGAKLLASCVKTLRGIM